MAELSQAVLKDRPAHPYLPLVEAQRPATAAVRRTMDIAIYDDLDGSRTSGADLRQPPTAPSSIPLIG